MVCYKDAEDGSKLTYYVAVDTKNVQLLIDAEQDRYEAKKDVWEAIPKEKRGPKPTRTEVSRVRDNISQTQAKADVKKMNDEVAASRGGKKAPEEKGSDEEDKGGKAAK